MALVSAEVLVPDGWLADRAGFEAACREGHEASPDGAGASVFGRAWFMHLDPLDESLTPCLLADGFWESWVSLAFARAVRPGAHVVDVGAHAGWFTLLALARGAGRVLAVEPQPGPLRRLLRTVQDAGLGARFDKYGGALWDAWGSEELNLYGRLTGSAGIPPAIGWTPSGSLRVQTAPLDGLLEDWRPWARVDLVKVDAEGSEARIWRGMRATLAANPRAAVLMEVGTGRGYALGAFLSELQADGWRVRAVDEVGELAGPDGLEDFLAPLWEDPERLGNLWIDRPEAEEAAA